MPLSGNPLAFVIRGNCPPWSDRFPSSAIVIRFPSFPLIVPLSHHFFCHHHRRALRDTWLSLSFLAISFVFEIEESFVERMSCHYSYIKATSSPPGLTAQRPRPHRQVWQHKGHVLTARFDSIKATSSPPGLTAQRPCPHRQVWQHKGRILTARFDSIKAVSSPPGLTA